MRDAFTTSATITAPAAEVWRTMTDWSRALRWMSGVERFTADGPLQPGTVLTIRTRGRRVLARSDGGQPASLRAVVEARSEVG